MHFYVADAHCDFLFGAMDYGWTIDTQKRNQTITLENLQKGGVALLYTMEFTLLKNLIRERSHLEILSQGRTEAGGLTPMIFIIRVN